MKEIKAVGDFKIYEKRSGRYAVKNADRAYVNGDDKAKILADAGLVTIPEPKAKEEPVAEEENSAEEATEEAAEAEETAGDE